MKLNEIRSELSGMNIIPIGFGLDQKEKHQEFKCLALKVVNDNESDKVKGMVFLIWSKLLHIMTSGGNDIPFSWRFIASKLVYLYVGVWIGDGKVTLRGRKWIPEGLAPLIANDVLKESGTGFSVLSKWTERESLMVPYMGTENTEGWILKSNNALKKGFRHILKEFNTPQEESVTITINTLRHLHHILYPDDFSSSRMDERCMYSY